jgi:hypothetical protein
MTKGMHPTWWRWTALAFAGLAAWNCSEAREAGKQAAEQELRALNHSNRWRRACSHAEHCSGCDMASYCP